MDSHSYIAGNRSGIIQYFKLIFKKEQFNDSNELDLEYFEKNCAKANNFVSKDQYVLEIEKEAVMFMLSLFQKNAQTHMPLPRLV